MLIQRLCHSPIQYVVMTRVELADKLLINTVYCVFFASRKYVFHIGCELVQTRTSLRCTKALIDVRCNRSAIGTKLKSKHNQNKS